MTGALDFATQSLDPTLNLGPLPNTDPISGDRTITYTYDQAERLETETGPSIDGQAGVITRYHYDAHGNLTDTIQAEGLAEARTIHRVYDTLGRITEEIRAFNTPEAATERYTYDAFGNQTHVIDPRGVELAETNTDWALAERERLGFTITEATTRPKLASELSEAEHAVLLARYTTLQVFDQLNRKITAIAPDTSTTITEYDAFGNIVKAIDPNGNAGYFYHDALHRVTLQLDPEGYVTQTIYDAYGNATETINYANAVTVPGGAVLDATTRPVIYDGTGAAPTQPYVLMDPDKDQHTLASYDALNRSSSITTYADDTTNYTESFIYDALGNVTQHTDKNGNVFVYEYDANGNKIAERLPVTSEVPIDTWDQVDVLQSDTTYIGRDHHMALDDDGNAIAVWVQFNSVYANRYVAGEGWQGPTVLHTLPGNAYRPTAGFDNNGNVIVVWMQFDDTSFGRSIYVRHYADGAWQATYRFEETGNPGNPGTPEIDFDTEGNATVVWLQSDGTTTRLYEKRHLATGGWQGATPVASGVGDFPDYLQFDVNAHGNAVAIWVGQDGGVNNIYASRYVDGAWQGPDVLDTGSGNAQHPRIALDDRGNAIAVWSQYDASSHLSLYSRVYSHGAWGEVQLLETSNTASDFADDAQIAFDAEGNAMVVWYQNAGIYANRYLADIGWQGANQIGTHAYGSKSLPQIAIDRQGNAMVVWNGPDATGTLQVYSNRYVNGQGSTLR